MSPLISVVMPAYNAEKYIAEAIESVLQQTFKDWELIIVDDCSTDNTWNIISGYSIKYNNIRIYHLDKNSGGCQIPRRKAFEFSKGEWIHCLDADDYISPECLEMLYQRAIESQAEIVYQQSRLSSNKTEGIIPHPNFNFSQVLNGLEACQLTIGGWQINANGGLIKREILATAYNIFQDKYTGSYGDEIITRLALLSASKVAFSQTIYWRREVMSSISREISIKRLGLLPTVSILKQIILKYYPKDIVIQQKMELQYWQAVKYCRNLFITSITNQKEKEILSFIKTYWKDVNIPMIYSQLKLVDKLTIKNYFLFINLYKIHKILISFFNEKRQSL